MAVYITPNVQSPVQKYLLISTAIDLYIVLMYNLAIPIANFLYLYLFFRARICFTTDQT
jgi:hypothetical protein